MSARKKSPKPSRPEAEAVAELLVSLRLRATPARLAVLAALKHAGKPLSHADVEAALPTPLDRVTLYRTLDTFVEVGLASRSVGADRVGRFAFADTSSDHHEHAHFLCDDCGRSICLPAPLPAPASLPAGFAVTSTDLSFHGHCADCQTASRPRHGSRSQGSR